MRDTAESAESREYSVSVQRIESTESQEYSARVQRVESTVRECIESRVQRVESAVREFKQPRVQCESTESRSRVQRERTVREIKESRVRVQRVDRECSWRGADENAESRDHSARAQCEGTVHTFSAHCLLIHPDALD